MNTTVRFWVLCVLFYGMYSYVRKTHTSLSAWIFVVAGVGLLLVTLATVSYQAVRAALMNPVKSLRTE